MKDMAIQSNSQQSQLKKQKKEECPLNMPSKRYTKSVRKNISSQDI